MAHAAEAYPNFCIMNSLEVLLLYYMELTAQHICQWVATPPNLVVPIYTQ